MSQTTKSEWKKGIFTLLKYPVIMRTTIIKALLSNLFIVATSSILLILFKKQPIIYNEKNSIVLWLKLVVDISVFVQTEP